MNDVFRERVRAAAMAGWWTLLIAVIFLVLQWFAYLAIMSSRPAWLLSLWGPDITWPFFQNLWFWIVGIFKLCLWLLALIVIWLALWARQLRSPGNGV